MTLTKNDLDNLVKLYDKAVKDGKYSFMFKDNEILTIYAKYLIEYLKTKLTT